MRKPARREVADIAADVREDRILGADLPVVGVGDEAGRQLVIVARLASARGLACRTGTDRAIANRRFGKEGRKRLRQDVVQQRAVAGHDGDAERDLAGLGDGEPVLRTRIVSGRVSSAIALPSRRTKPALAGAGVSA